MKAKMRMQTEVIHELLKKGREKKKLAGVCKKIEADSICNFSRALNRTSYGGGF